MSNTSNSVYQIVLDLAPGPMQGIAYLDESEKQKLDGLSEDPEEYVNVRYFRHLNQTDKGLGFHEVLPYANEHEYHLAKSKILMYTKASSTLADIFTNYVYGTTGFAWEKNIPYYNSDVKFAMAGNTPN